MKVIDQDLLDVTEGVIIQSVNCQGVMGSGVALAIRNRWPNVYEGYQERVRWARIDEEQLLGKLFVAMPDPNVGLYVANMFCQDDYNRQGQRKRHTNYGAVAKAFTTLYDLYPHLPRYVPFRFGCDRGGADFEVVSEIVDFVCPGVIACRI